MAGTKISLSMKDVDQTNGTDLAPIKGEFQCRKHNRNPFCFRYNLTQCMHLPNPKPKTRLFTPKHDP